MHKKIAVRRLGVVAGLTAALIGVGGASAAAFADSTTPTGVGPVGFSGCPDGWKGVIIWVGNVPIEVCTNI